MKIGVVAFWTLPLVAPSQKPPILPLLATNKMKIHFLCGKSKTLVIKVVALGNMHISTKNGVKSHKFAMELAQTMVTRVESRVNSCLVLFFVKGFSLKHQHARFGIFPRYYITYYDSMRWYSIFLIFFEIILLPFKI
jgi:hypothetical protein